MINLNQEFYIRTLMLMDEYPILLQDLDEDNVFDPNFVDIFVTENKTKLFNEMRFEHFADLMFYRKLMIECIMEYDEDDDDFPTAYILFESDIEIEHSEDCPNNPKNMIQSPESHQNELEQKRIYLQKCIDSEKFEEADITKKEIKSIEDKINKKD